MLSINTNSAYTYGCQTSAYRRQNIQKTFAGTVNQQLTPPSVIHIGELGFGADNLGRQYALNYAEDSTDENPIVIAKGNDEYGQQFEERIYLNDIDLNNASYLEMAALAVHTKTDIGRKNGDTFLEPKVFIMLQRRKKNMQILHILPLNIMKNHMERVFSH